jgi:hypothetical protein
MGPSRRRARTVLPGGSDGLRRLEMSDFKQYDEELEEGEFLYDEGFDAGAFVDAMHDVDHQKRRPKRARRRSALELIERRNEERWLREQLRDLEDDELFH